MVNNTFSYSRWNSQIIWRRSGSENIHLNPGQPTEEKNKKVFDSCSISGNCIYRHHTEPRVKLFVPREESFPIPLRYIDATRATSTTLDVMLERRIDDYLIIERNRDLSDSWIGFTRFTILDEKLPDGYTWSGERLTKKQTTSRLVTCGQKYGKTCQKQRTEKQNWAVGKSKLDNARKLQDIYFIVKKYAEKFVRSSDASSNALQDQGKKVQGNLSHS